MSIQSTFPKILPINFIRTIFRSVFMVLFGIGFRIAFWNLLLACTLPVFLIQAQVKPKGKLFIIGGGKRPPELIQRMLLEARNPTGKVNYVVILPFASEEQDSSIFYASKQFVEAHIPVMSFMLKQGDKISNTKLDSIAHAGMIYMPGGDQVKFMNIVSGTGLGTGSGSSTGISEAIRKSYQNGGLIGGTSAGAAVMSQKMITGVELKYKNTSEDTETDGFRTIEEQNIEISSGLGLIQNAIIDQHFVKRKRMNRLMTVALENPGFPCFGIDESTALLVKNGLGEVVGASQIIYVKSNSKANVKSGKIGGKALKLAIYIPGDIFKIE